MGLLRIRLARSDKELHCSSDVCRRRRTDNSIGLYAFHTRHTRENAMKIAIFQNFLDTIGGSEVVGLTTARELHADIYTTNIDRSKITAMGFTDVLPRIFSIGRVPRSEEHTSELQSR